VQGDKVASELIKALQEARTFDVDAVVIVRGGGSKMDLNVFNDYELSKTICETKLPVIVGVGHEHDEVVSDLVCRKMCFTPTTAAEFLYIQIGFTLLVLLAFSFVVAFHCYYCFLSEKQPPVILRFRIPFCAT